MPTRLEGTAAHLGALALALVASLCVYASAFGGAFVFDDLTTLVPRMELLERGDLAALLETYRPIRYLSFVPDYALFGDDPTGYHVFNALYHGLTAFLVFVLLQRLLGGWRGAAFGALVFLVHPVHTESVAYISGRRDVLTTLFYLGAFYAHLRFGETGRWRWLAALAGLFLLALGAKEMAVTLPALLCVHDLLLDRPALRRRWWVYGALFAAAAGAACWAIFERDLAHAFHGGSAGAHYGTALRLAGHYLGLLVAPVTLLADYSYEAFPLSRGLLEPRVLGAAALLVTLLAAAIACWRRAPRVSFAIAWFFVTILPVAQLVPYAELGAEHYLYLPSVGFCLLVGLGFARLLRATGPKRAAALAAVVLALLGARTVTRNADWRDGPTLWASVLEAAPRCVRAHVNLGVKHARKKEYAQAERHLAAAVAIEPGNAYARCMLGQLYRETGRHAEANAQLEAALVIVRGDPRSRVDEPTVLMGLGRLVEAVLVLERRIERRPGDTGALYRLAVCHQNLGNPKSALRAVDRILAQDPRSRRALSLGARLATSLGDGNRAAAYRARLRLLGAPPGPERP